uniref:Putative ABC transporter, ATP-binding component n=1 Tax=Paulinella micropora TaxID=1928728 RepID=A0A385HZZ9_9EUKA|nr:putative ABC transporter, ATP-binding component [Paulinella micropora]AXY63242.1 putative ABC transporter, ATP-binding component [Paulinella micropora]
MVLRLEQVSFSWPSGHNALWKCNLIVPKPGLWMLLGKNGSGKSTLFRVVKGLLKHQSGCITCTSKTALVFQNPDHQLLLPTCGSDLRLQMPAGLVPDTYQYIIDRTLSMVGLEGFAERPLYSLSGGQKQRLAIAGAILSEAGLLLLDEPSAFLDPETQNDLLELVSSLCNRNKFPLTALWITHRLEELDACTGAAVMEKGQISNWIEGNQLRMQLNPLPFGQVKG